VSADCWLETDSTGGKNHIAERALLD
jgi:hypothetical protein